VLPQGWPPGVFLRLTLFNEPLDPPPYGVLVHVSDVVLELVGLLREIM